MVKFGYIALKVARKINDMNGFELKAKFKIAKKYEENGFLKEALQILVEIIEGHPECVEAYSRSTIIYHGNMDGEIAIKYAHLALTIDAS